jgi:hypothetical protein
MANSERSIVALEDHIANKRLHHPEIDGLFAYHRNGLRMAIASIEDETWELLDAWRVCKRDLSAGRRVIQHELLDIAMICMIAYENSLEGK